MSLSDDALGALTALAGVALTQTDLEATLVEVCRNATRAVPGAEGVSITTFPQGRPGALASDEWSRGLDD